MCGLTCDCHLEMCSGSSGNLSLDGGLAGVSFGMLMSGSFGFCMVNRRAW